MKMMRVALVLLACCFTLLTSYAEAASTAKLTRKTLSNGLRVVIEHRPAMRNTIVATSYRAGAIDEPQGGAGLAAVTRELMRGGDGKVGTARKRLARAGVVSRVDATDELTAFVSAMENRHLALSLWFEALRMATIDVTEDEVTEALEQLGHARRLRGKRDLLWHGEAALRSLALGRTSPAAVFTGLTVDEVRAFHGRHYAPDRAALVIIGPTAPGAALKLVEKTVGTVRRSGAPIQVPEVLPQASPRHTSLRSRGAHRAAIAHGFRIPAGGHDDDAALAVTAELLAGGPASALHRELVSKKAWAFSVRAELLRSSGPGLLMIYVEGPRHIKPIDLATVVQLQAQQLAPRPELVAAARARVHLGASRKLANVRSRARELGSYELLHGDAHAALKRLQDLSNVGVDDVRRIVKTYLFPENASLVECFPAEIHLNEADQAARDKAEKAAREKAEKEAKRRSRGKTRKGSKGKPKGSKGKPKGTKPKGKPKGTKPKGSKPKGSKRKGSKPKPKSSKPKGKTRKGKTRKGKTRKGKRK